MQNRRIEVRRVARLTGGRSSLAPKRSSAIESGLRVPGAKRTPTAREATVMFPVAGLAESSPTHAHVSKRTSLIQSDLSPKDVTGLESAKSSPIANCARRSHKASATAFRCTTTHGRSVLFIKGATGVRACAHLRWNWRTVRQATDCKTRTQHCAARHRLRGNASAATNVKERARDEDETRLRVEGSDESEALSARLSTKERQDQTRDQLKTILPLSRRHPYAMPYACT